ncbi:hypothetical protein M885DRAFT_14237 [Pelagophyceae sp. CCMP2097]|nr:hypothetical protein M885DRAFT_14237 [Pelagophyceae sp. CCMP2097]
MHRGPSTDRLQGPRGAPESKTVGSKGPYTGPSRACVGATRGGPRRTDHKGNRVSLRRGYGPSPRTLEWTRERGVQVSRVGREGRLSTASGAVSASDRTRVDTDRWGPSKSVLAGPPAAPRPVPDSSNVGGLSAEDRASGIFGRLPKGLRPRPPACPQIFFFLNTSGKIPPGLASPHLRAHRGRIAVAGPSKRRKRAPDLWSRLQFFKSTMGVPTGPSKGCLFRIKGSTPSTDRPGV